MTSPIKMNFLKILTLSFFILNTAHCGVNNIPTYDEATKAAWSQVLNQYQRRADLIPSLVSTVKGYAKHEKGVLVEVTEARSRVTSTPVPKDILTNQAAFQKFQQNQQQLSSALARLMVVVERYPDLKANQNFIALQSQLEGTENRIAVARKDYIEAVQKYNTELRTIPGRWWASAMYPDAKVKENFTADDSVQKAPKVEF